MKSKNFKLIHRGIFTEVGHCKILAEVCFIKFEYNFFAFSHYAYEIENILKTESVAFFISKKFGLLTRG